jgi:hypothetical protein
MAETPFFHWYIGDVPPLTGVAVKGTDVPAQTLLDEAPMLTLTGNTGFTVIVIALEVAGLPVAQVADEESTHVTTSSSSGTYENAEFPPDPPGSPDPAESITTPFTIHR